MERKKALAIGLAVAAMATPAIAFFQWRFPVFPEEKPSPTPQITINNQPIVQVGMQGGQEGQKKEVDAFSQQTFDDAKLTVLGAGATVRILRSEKNYPYMGGFISEAGVKQTIFLPSNQRLQLEIEGAGTKILVEKAIFENVHVLNAAAGATVHPM